jgi:uncharacterized membrane protein
MSAEAEQAAEPSQLAPAVAEAEPTFWRVQTMLAAPVGNERSALTVVFILGLIAYTSGGVIGAVVLLGILAAQDLVRFLVMKALDAVDGRMLFLPLARHAAPIGLAPGREAAVIVVGPFFYALLAGVAYVADRAAHVPLASEVAATSVGLAFFFLLPLKPYDGWKLLNLCLFSRSARVEATVAAVTSVMLAFVAFTLQLWVIMVVGVLQLFGIPIGLKIQRAAAALKARLGEVPAVDTAKLDEPALRAVYDATREQLSLAEHAAKQPDAAAKNLVTFMREVHALAARPRISVGMTALLLVVYGALITYFVAGVLIAAVFAQAGAQ